MTLAAGTMLGRYEIIGVLGAGGMGEVYRARDMRLGRDLAIKVLPPEYAGNPGKLARFEREARAVAALNHPGIVTLYEIEEIEGTRFLAMELVEGRPLSDLIPSGGLSLDRLLALAIPVAEALAAAHDNGIVHRDLKPANVMVDQHGRVKVLDFGLARLEADREPATEATVTLSGDRPVVGTIPYMAPEQLAGGGVDPRADLFSFGVMLHEMATGSRTFLGASPMQIAAAILREEPPRLEALRPGWPPQFARIVRRCLAKEPDQRTRSALDLANELRDLADEVERQPSTEKRPATAKPRVRRQPARRRREGLRSDGHRVPPAAVPAPATSSAGLLPLGNRTREAAPDNFVEGAREATVTVRRKPHRIRPEAVDAFLRGRQVFDSEDFVAGNVFPKAERFFEEATRLDPEFPDAWGDLASSRVWQAFFGLRPASEVVPLSREAANRALALDEGTGRAWSALGVISLYFDWDFAKAREQLERAVSLRPDDAAVRHAYSDYFMVMGRTAESLAQVHIGHTRNPSWLPGWVAVVAHAVAARRYGEAIDEARAILAAHPEVRNSRHFLAKALWLTDHHEEAIVEFGRLWGPSGEQARILGDTCRKAGPVAAMKAVADFLAVETAGTTPNPTEVASFYAIAHEADAAFAWLEKAFAQRAPGLLHVPADPFFDPIRRDPRIDDLCLRVGLPVEAWRGYASPVAASVVPA